MAALAALATVAQVLAEPSSLTTPVPMAGLPIPPRHPVNELHADIQKRFVLRPQGLVLDYVNADDSTSLPDAEDCRLGRPNALSWWTPLENGPFLTGLYLDGILRRHARTVSMDDARLAREFVEGLLRCASLDPATPGFIARGYYLDPENPDAPAAYYGIGSDDQTAPWFYGLWRYLRSGLPSPDETRRITAKMLEVARALQRTNWQMPCSPVGALAPGQYRGGWAWADYRGATRLLFVLRIAAELEPDNPAWAAEYRRALADTVGRGPEARPRIDLVADGMPGEWKQHPNLSRNHFWIYIVSQAMVHELHELETVPSTKERFRVSLQTNAEICAQQVPEVLPVGFGSAPMRTDWHTMNALWESQRTADQAVALALRQLGSWGNAGRHQEINAVREPFCAAWIAFFAPDRSQPAIRDAAIRFESLFRQVPWTTLHSSHGIFAESAWYLIN